MVYQGKPSKGCQMCRSRRIKCQKSRRQCPGYKDEFDLVFRNETQATERRAQRASKKAQAKKAKKGGSPSTSSLPESSLMPVKSESSSPASQISSSSWSYSPIPPRPPLPAKHPVPINSLWRTPQLGVDDQAACFFISNYVLIPQQGSTRGFLEYVVPILTEGHVSAPFKQAFDACALATLANHLSLAADLEKRALQKYTQALSLVSRALRNPESRLQDSTLAAVLLLGLFENVTAQQPAMFAWGSHIEGAVQLVEGRGPEQFQTKIGIAMFIAVRTQMIIHTLSTAKLPKSGLGWWAKDEAVRNKYASQCQELGLCIGDIKAKVNRLMQSLPRNKDSIEAMKDLIKQAQAVDRRCLAWAESLPSHFRYNAVHIEEYDRHCDHTKAEIFPGRVDAYQDLWIASIWNMMRCSRIILASTVVRCTAWICSPIDYRTTPEYIEAAKMCIETIEDIIASVPYQLGWFSSRKFLLQHPSLSQFACGVEETPKSLAGYFLAWPLALVQGQDYTTELQRAWVKQRLVYIGKELGVRSALMLSELRIRTPSMLIKKDGQINQTPPFSTVAVQAASSNDALSRLDEAYKRGIITESQIAQMM
ncbi:Uncharacterized protein ESCO_002595 [Escovopsis weberi]|uniref:Negative acting factor n=1 Tax=Escovopsis weberi TaxID=150374 RepID=A0A0M8MTH1_ESCWE|nr:Uncharacterized protein ESCO_002595 [Escovopsis weberi]